MSAWLTSFHEPEYRRRLERVLNCLLKSKAKVPLRVVYRRPASAVVEDSMWTRGHSVRHDMRFRKNESNSLIASVMYAPVVGRRPVR